jgi:hypothetical protein
MIEILAQFVLLGSEPVHGHFRVHARGNKQGANARKTGMSRFGRDECISDGFHICCFFLLQFSLSPTTWRGAVTVLLPHHLLFVTPFTLDWTGQVQVHHATDRKDSTTVISRRASLRLKIRHDRAIVMA